jgi:hypothetical protein
MLAAIDGDALYQLVVLVLLGGGSLLKSLREKAAKDSGAAERQGLGESMADRVRSGRGDVMSRLAAFEERQEREGKASSDPWQEMMGVEGELEAAAQAAEDEELYLEELMVEVPVPAAGAATPEVSLEGVSLEGSSFDDDNGALFTTDWEPGSRISEAVREDIEKKVSMDITAHVEADMAGGVRGDAKPATSQPVKHSKVRHSWRDAVIAAELLGAPLALRAPESQVPGLRND